MSWGAFLFLNQISTTFFMQFEGSEHVREKLTLCSYLSVRRPPPREYADCALPALRAVQPRAPLLPRARPSRLQPAADPQASAARPKAQRKLPAELAWSCGKHRSG